MYTYTCIYYKLPINFSSVTFAIDATSLRHTNINCCYSNKRAAHRCHVSDLCDCATHRTVSLQMAKMLFLLAALYAVFTVGEFAGILRKQFLQEPLYVEGEADTGEPLFLTPYVKRKEYLTGTLFL